MLKFIVQSKPFEPPDHRAKLLVLLRDMPILTINELHGNYTQLWDISGTREQTASLLHGLELGIASAARWIAVELLKKPAPPTTAAKKKGIDGVALWLAKNGDLSCTLRLHSANVKGGAHLVLGTIEQSEVYTLASDIIDAPGRACLFATREQALAALIEHGAAWIAAALVKEIET